MSKLLETSDMADFPAVQNTGSLTKFLQGIPDRGVPNKVTIEHLQSIGFKSTNDRPIVAVLKFVGVLQQDGRPSEAYKQLRNRETGKKTLAAMIRKAYSDLFEVYPNANVKESGTLQNYFASKTNVGAGSLRNIVGTFQALCASADFSGSSVVLPEESNEDQTASGAKMDGKQSGDRRHHFPKAEVHFDIQIHLPGDQKPEIYEAIFKSLGKHVLGTSGE